jgi:hypothetical protein
MKTKPPEQPSVSVAIIEDNPIRLVGLRSLGNQRHRVGEMEHRNFDLRRDVPNHAA